MFNFVANKHPGICAYCTRRVQRQAGCIWLDGGVWHVAHSECVHEAIRDGRGPEVADPKAGVAPRLKQAREIMRTVRMDAPAGELERAWAALVDLVQGQEGGAHVPF